jgi:macrolide transport system ATP-binding/permease protein
MDSVLQNLKFALRQLRRYPGFTLTVVLTLALSIGVNTALFSLVNALLIRSLPYAEPDKLATIYARTTGAGNSTDSMTGMDGEKWELLRDNVPALLSAVSSGGVNGVNLQASGHVQYLHEARISAHYLDVLRIHPLLGRNFSEDEDRPHGAPVAILSYGLWQSTFAANPEILGSAISLKGEPYTVIGVLPEGATTPQKVDLYTALQPSRTGEGAGTNYEAIARLRDGATWQQADAQINQAWAARVLRFEQNRPGAQVFYHAVPLKRGETESLRPQAMRLTLAAGFILLIACANLAGLTLVRVLRRQPEIATRMALGATSWQIQKQLWIENLLLAIVGGACSLGVGWLALRGLLTLLPKHFLPVEHVPLDSTVLGFTLLVSLLTSLLFGMLPALITRKVDLRSSIAAGSSRGTSGGGTTRVRQALIAGEVALTVVLLAASGLLIRTLVHLESLPAGFNPAGVMTAKASLDDARYHDVASFTKLLNQSTLAMRQIPGVEDAAVGLSLPYERNLNDSVTIQDGAEKGQQVGTDEVYITPGYFNTLQMPLVSGRAFTDSDGADSQHVVILNQTFVRKFFHGTNPVGRYLGADKAVIVGVVADVAAAPGLNPAAPLASEETLYFPASQIEEHALPMIHVWFQPSWIVRTHAPSANLTAEMQRALASADPNQPFSGFYSMNDLLAQTLATQRVEVALLSTMASLALILSAVGIFALVSNMVLQRTREIGIRIALGSTSQQAMIQVGKGGAIAAAAGLVAGLVLCLFALKGMQSELYGVGTYDAKTLLSVIATLAAVTLFATAIPVLKIARVDPAKTLREE